MAKKLLNEIYKSKMEIKKEEGNRPGVLCVVEGKFGEYGKVNRNNRLYGRGVWESVISSEFVQEALRNKTFFGEADHPAEDRVDPTLSLVSHSVTDLWLEGDQKEGFIMGRADVLDTACGKIVHTLLEYGSVLGISSRAFGDVESTSEGYEKIVEDGFECTAFDFVTMPGFECARLPLKEGKKKGTEDLVESMKAKLEAMSVPELKDVRSIFEASGEFGKELLEAVDSRLERISSSEDPVLLVEEGERKARYYRRRSELVESAISRVSENAKKIIYGKDEEIERLKLALKEKEESTEELLIKSPEFPEGEKADLSVGEEAREGDKESAEKLLKVMGRAQAILRAELGEVQEESRKYKNKLTLLREKYKESINCLEEKLKENKELSRGLEETKKRVEEIEETSRLLVEERSRVEAQLAEASRREEDLNSKFSELQEAHSGLQGELKKVTKKLEIAESVARSVVEVSGKRVGERKAVDFSLKRSSLVGDSTSEELMEEKRMRNFLIRAKGGN